MHTIVPGIVVRSHLLFFPRILIENDRLKRKDEIVWRKEREKYSWEYEKRKAKCLRSTQNIIYGL